MVGIAVRVRCGALFSHMHRIVLAVFLFFFSEFEKSDYHFGRNTSEDEDGDRRYGMGCAKMTIDNNNFVWKCRCGIGHLGTH